MPNTITFFDPSEFNRGKTQISKDQLFKNILNKKYNNSESYITMNGKGKRRIQNFVESTEESTGKKYITFTLRYGRQPIATIPYDEETQGNKESFIKNVLAQASKDESLKDKVWSIHKSMSRTNSQNAKGTDLALADAS